MSDLIQKYKDEISEIDLILSFEVGFAKADSETDSYRKYMDTLLDDRNILTKAVEEHERKDPKATA